MLVKQVVLILMKCSLNTELMNSVWLDGLPLLYLHSMDCRNRCGQVCLHLPPNAFQSLEEDLALDYDLYQQHD